MPEDRFVIENKLWMITAPVGVSVYDFGFRDFFDCRTPYDTDVTLPGVARVGAFDDYAAFYAAARRDGILLLNTPAEQERCSSLPGWYPLLSDLTPRSRWFDTIPTFEEIADPRRARRVRRPRRPLKSSAFRLRRPFALIPSAAARRLSSFAIFRAIRGR